jgi:hypothetical protein
MRNEDGRPDGPRRRLEAVRDRGMAVAPALLAVLFYVRHLRDGYLADDFLYVDWARSVSDIKAVLSTPALPPDRAPALWPVLAFRPLDTAVRVAVSSPEAVAAEEPGTTLCEKC